MFFRFIILLTLSSELLNFLLTFVVPKLRRTFGKQTNKQRKQTNKKTGGLKRMDMYNFFPSKFTKQEYFVRHSAQKRKK